VELKKKIFFNKLKDGKEKILFNFETKFGPAVWPAIG